MSHSSRQPRFRITGAMQQVLGGGPARYKGLSEIVVSRFEEPHSTLDSAVRALYAHMRRAGLPGDTLFLVVDDPTRGSGTLVSASINDDRRWYVNKSFVEGVPVTPRRAFENPEFSARIKSVARAVRARYGHEWDEDETLGLVRGKRGRRLAIRRSSKSGSKGSRP